MAEEIARLEAPADASSRMMTRGSLRKAREAEARLRAEVEDCQAVAEEVLVVRRVLDVVRLQGLVRELEGAQLVSDLDREGVQLYAQLRVFALAFPLQRLRLVVDTPALAGRVRVVALLIAHLSLVIPPVLSSNEASVALESVSTALVLRLAWSLTPWMVSTKSLFATICWVRCLSRSEHVDWRQCCGIVSVSPS